MDDIYPDRELLTPVRKEGDISIRPSQLPEFVGQEAVTQALQVAIQAALMRGEPLDHVLLYGPPGLGKTTLAKIIAQSQNAAFIEVAAPHLNRPGDILKILTGLKRNDVLFIDEVHRLPAVVEETLYSAMEDRKVDIVLSEGMTSAPVAINLEPFTLVGATTRPGDLTAPLRDRFGIQQRLDFYPEQAIAQIILRAAEKWDIDAREEGISEIARRSRHTPRIALRLLRRIWDYALVKNAPLDREIALEGFRLLAIDDLGLTDTDRQFLRIMRDQHAGGPVGLKPLSAVLAEDITTLEESVEPYLVRTELIRRSQRGRILTPRGYMHLNEAGSGLFHE